MSAIQPLYCLLGISIHHLSKKESLLLEAQLFKYICDELKEYFKKQYNDYFYLMKFSKEKEDVVLETNFIRLIMNDILTSEEYTLAGISYCTNIHEDILQEVFMGKNNDPSAKLVQRIIELHYSIRKELYHAIMKKIAMQYLEAA